MVQLELLARIVSGIAALMLVTAAVVSLRGFRIPRPVLTFVRGYYAVLCLAPALSLLLFAALVVRARWILGFWPYPRSFDPARGVAGITLSPLDPDAMPIHYGLVWIFLVVGMFAILWAIPAHALLRAAGRRLHPAGLSVLVAGWAVMFLLPLLDPGGFFDWFLD